MKTEPFHVIIIGAGTGGLCLAHGLKRAGISVAVYERDETRTGGLQGYRVGISPHGSRALQACLPPELFYTFVSTCARAPKHFNMLTERMAEVLSLELQGGGDPVNSEKSVSRMTLRQVLITGLENVIHFGKKFERYESLPDGRVKAWFEDGTCATGDLLVAADGARSKVRKQFLPHAKMEDTGIVSIGAKVPMSETSRALLPPKVLEGLSLIQAPHGVGAIVHVMEFKWDRQGIKHGIGGNDASLLAAWPGLLFDNTVDYISWGVWASRGQYKLDPAKLRGAELIAQVLDMTADWHPDFRRLISLSDSSTVFPISIRTSVPVEPWPSCNITLLGDAIHTMTPGRGVGANTALRDAALLCAALASFRDGKETLVQALHGYEAEMLRYGFEAVLDSRKQMDAGDIIHKPVLGRIALAMTRTVMRTINAVPALRRKMAQQLERSRGSETTA